MGSPRAGTRQQQRRLDSGRDTEEPDLALLTSRVVALTGRAELATLDTELEAEKRRRAAGPSQWRLALWSGMRALLEGRLAACDALAREAAGATHATDDDSGVTHVDLLGVSLRCEQDRPAEAEAILRNLLGREPSLLAGRVAWASLLGAVGRDSQARAELRRLAVDNFAEVRDDPGWLAAMCQLAELAALVDRAAEAGVLYRHLAPYAWRFAVEPAAAVCHGSVSLYLGVLARRLERWDDARRHFEDALTAHRAAGAPILAAHTLRHYAALLRTNCRDDDWERAVEMLAQAEHIYRRLGIDGRATECQTLLARAHGSVGPSSDSTDAWHHDGARWIVRFGDRSVDLEESTGVRDLALLMSHPGRSFHVADLWAGTRQGVGRAGTNGSGLGRRPGGAAIRTVTPNQVAFDDETGAECRARLDELESELADAIRRQDGIAVALARAERELVAGDVEGAAAWDPVDRIRHLVTLRIRRAVDGVGQAHPELGRHLRDSVRTGTLCAYEPPGRTSWLS